MRALAVTERAAAADVVEVADPVAGAGQVRVAVAAASVNGFDLAVVSGRVWDSMKAAFPVVIGRDFTGTVESVGDGVTEVAVGDRVVGTIHAALGPGGIGEYVVQPASVLAPLPDGVSFEQAAAIGLAGGAAADVFDALEVSAGDVVFVSGATGGVGLYLVQLLAGAGARVIATATPGAAEDVVRRLGANDVVDHLGDVAAQVRAVAPDGVDKVAHLAGDAAAVSGLAKTGGRVASLLGASAESVGRDDIAVVAIQARVPADKLARLLAEVVAGRLEVVVASTYPLEKATDALDAFRETPFGKIVITIGRE
jgi:NADPH:quinone reductase-like Zn-dependent oxidoreductase